MCYTGCLEAWYCVSCGGGCGGGGHKLVIGRGGGCCGSGDYLKNVGFSGCGSGGDCLEAVFCNVSYGGEGC